jgi:hypothetical protein
MRGSVTVQRWAVFLAGQEEPAGPLVQGWTYLWIGVGVMLVLGIGLIVWGSLSGPGPAGRDVSARRSSQMQVGAVLVGVSMCALVIAYLTADWP